MKKYIRTEHNIWEVVSENELVYNVKAKGNPHNKYSKSKRTTVVLKEAERIEDLVMTGDLLIIEDRVVNKTFPTIYDEILPFDYDSVIFRIKEFYIKDNENYIKVAEAKETGELELL